MLLRDFSLKVGTGGVFNPTSGNKNLYEINNNNNNNNNNGVTVV
jgi:hypothetical protein